MALRRRRGVDVNTAVFHRDGAPPVLKPHSEAVLSRGPANCVEDGQTVAPYSPDLNPQTTSFGVT